MRLFCLFCLWLVTMGLEAGYKHELAVCAIFRNEAPYMQEWIEFHRLMGVEKFYLYNNLSDDNCAEIVAPYVKMGIVELIDWPHSYLDVATWSGIQKNAYDDCLNRVKGQVRWVAFLDLDEFLFPTQKHNLKDLLKKYRKFGALGVNWQMYGTGGVKKIPKGMLLIESLLYKGETTYRENVHIKSIVQPEHVLGASSPHHFLLAEGFLQVNSNQEQFEGPYSPSILVDQVRINHYWSRDETYFFKNKMARRTGWHEGKDGILLRNEAISKVYDPCILRFAKPLRRLLRMK